MTSATTPMTRPKGECFPSILVYPGPSGELSGWGLFIFAFYVWRLKSHSLSLSASDGSTDVQKDFADGFRVSVFSLFFVPRNINTSKQTACCKGCPLKTVTRAKPQYQDTQWNHKSKQQPCKSCQQQLKWSEYRPALMSSCGELTQATSKLRKKENDHFAGQLLLR